MSIKSGNKKITDGDYKTYNGMRIGLLKNNSRNEDLKKFAKEKGFTYKPVYYDSVSTMKQDIQDEKNVDALMTSNLRSIKNEWVIDEFSSSDFYVMVQKSNTALLKKINSAISSLSDDLPQWRTTLWDKYYTVNTGNAIAFTTQEKLFIAENKKTTFTAIVSPDDRPYAYYDHGKMKGALVTIFKELSKRTGLTIKVVPIKTRLAYLKAIREKKADIIIDDYENFSHAEESGYRLTSSYLDTSFSRLTMKKKTQYQTIGVVKRNSYPTTIKTLIANKTIKYYNDVRACVRALDNGEIDAAYLYNYTASYYREIDEHNDMKSTLLQKYSISFALAVLNTRDNILLTVLDKGAKSVGESFAEETLQNMTQNFKAKTTLLSFVYANPLFVTMILSVGLIFLAGGIILILRQRNMRLLSETNQKLEKAVQQADRANQAKSQFLSRVSHEVRTPMNAIVGLTAIARDHVHDPKAITQYLSKIDSSSHMMLGIINDVLDMSAIESNKLSMA